jgi:nicotinamide-nucleotide amidase
MDPHLNALSAEVGAWLLARKLKLACAESCTGGWVAEVVTATAGSSEWFDCGFITYSDTLQRHGAVSEPTVDAMVAGVLSRSRADVVLAVSGIAGPGGGSPEKPVGTVCFAWGTRDGHTHCATCHFSGNRESVRRQAVFHALRKLMTMDFS